MCPMLQLAAFADEISPDLDVQIRIMRECGISHFELRSIDNIVHRGATAADGLLYPRSNREQHATILLELDARAGTR